MRSNIDDFVAEKDLEEGILHHDPVPANLPKPKKLDEFLSPFVSKFTERLDLSLEKIEKKLYDILGPLRRTWKILEDLNNGSNDSDEIELEGMWSSIQKSLVLIGQAINATTYQRRLYVLSSICKDSTKAKAQLKEKSDLFKNQSELFGERFQKHITLLTEERNKSKDLLRTLSAKKEHDPFYQSPHSK